MKKLLSLLFVSLLTFSCVEDTVEPEGNLTGSKIVGFGNSFESVAYFEDLGVVDKTFPVNLIGLGNGQTSADPIEVSYVIDSEMTTATEGVEFDFVDTSGKVIIPAGSTFGIFPLKVNTGAFSPTEKTELVLRLISATGETVVGEQYSTLKIVFVGCQSQLEGNYELVVTRNDGFVRTYASENITMTDINTFMTDNSGTYLPGQLAPAPTQGFEFIDICGDLTVPSQYLANYWGNILKGISSDGVDGHVIDANTFELVYEISFAAGNRSYSAVYTRNN